MGRLLGSSRVGREKQIQKMYELGSVFFNCLVTLLSGKWKAVKKYIYTSTVYGRSGCLCIKVIKKQLLTVVVSVAECIYSSYWYVLCDRLCGLS